MTVIENNKIKTSHAHISTQLDVQGEVKPKQKERKQTQQNESLKTYDIRKVLRRDLNFVVQIPNIKPEIPSLKAIFNL